MDSIRPLRILLIQAPLGRPEPLVYPLGIVTLAGVIPRQHAMMVLDPNRTGLQESAERIRDFQPDIICLSIRNLDSQIRRDLFYYYLHLKDFIKSVRKWCPGSILIAGGSGFSLFPEKIMRDNPDIDFGVFLEADESLPDLLVRLDDPSGVPGVYFRRDRQVCFSGPPKLPAPDQFGRPRYDLLDPLPYQALGGVGVQTKRGCPLHCIYCTYPHLNGHCLRMLPVGQVVEELTVLSRDYRVTEVSFVDGVFNVPKSRTESLLRAMREAGLNMRWRGWFTEQGFDRPFAELCRDAGCPEFSFSPDGFDDLTLKLLGKTIRKSDILRIFDIARETPGIRVAFNFFWNPPGQTFATWVRMIAFAIRCKLVLREKAGGIIFGNPRIEPHTPLLETAIRDGVLAEGYDLLPESVEALEKAFYSNPSTKYLDRLYLLYEMLWRLKKRIRG